MKNMLGLALLVSVVVAPSLRAEQASGPNGIWMRDDGNAKVRISRCGSSICATNLWIRDSSKGEAVGDKLIMSLRADSAETLSGTAYDPKRKASYAISVTVKPGGLVTRGCIIGGLLCRSVYWSPAR